VSVAQGASRSFTITPNTGYQITGVTVDGSSVGAVTTYTLSKVKANHKIRATFAVNAATTYTITATAGAGGSISPSGSVSVAQGASQSFTISPRAGYDIADVIIDGVSTGISLTHSTSTTFTFVNITADRTIKAIFLRSKHRQ
jgi:hypothetical protein